MRTKLSNWLTVVGVVVVAAALLAVAGVRGSQTSGPVASADPTQAPVSAAARSCAVFGTQDVAGAPLDVFNVALPREGADGDDAAASSAELLPQGKGVRGLALQRPATPASERVRPGEASAVLLEAEAALARFSAGFAATRPDDDLGGGLAVGECPSDSSSAWFVGAGATTNHSGTLVLSNPTGFEAVADIAMYGENGEVQLVGGTGIVVEPRGTKRIPMDRLATGEDDVALSVQTVRGSVSASVLDSAGELSSYDGSEFLPRAHAPATEVVIAGVPAQSESRELMVANPSDSAANVSVTVLGKNGSFQPSDLANLSVDAGAVEKVELPDGVGGGALSLRLTAQSPITGAVRATTSADTAYAAVAQRVAGKVAVPVDLGDAVGDASIDLAVTPAPVDKGGSVVLRAYDSKGEQVGSQTSVDVSAGATTGFDPVEEIGGAADRISYITVEPESAGIRGAVTYRAGDDWSTVPLTDLPDTVTRPAVAQGGTY